MGSCRVRHVLTGLKNTQNARCYLQRIYKRTLQILGKMPKDSLYRVNTERIICHRLSIVNDAENESDIEAKLSVGRLEMLVSQAEGEYRLSQAMLLWKPWKPLAEYPPPCQWKWPPPCTQ